MIFPRSARRAPWGWMHLLVVAALGNAGAVACGREAPAAKTAAGPDLPVVIDHQPCDITASSTVKVDTNGDGKADLFKVMAGDKEVCRMVDLNHDGVPDSFTYFDPSGSIARRESDFDRDGKIDEIARYAGGVVTRKDRETNLDARLDTWDFFENGKLHHRMRDSDGDGKVDEWWTWSNPDKPECAVIQADRNADGRPDPAETVDTCAAEHSASPAPVAPAAPTSPTSPTSPIASSAPGSPLGSAGAGDGGASGLANPSSAAPSSAAPSAAPHSSADAGAPSSVGSGSSTTSAPSAARGDK
jgi:hypothetical protein